jgi:dipeptidyl-peptidase-4
MRTVLIIILTFYAFAAGARHLVSDQSTVASSPNGQDFEGMKSMNDGEHFTMLENSARIVKYSYATGEEVGTVFSLADIPVQS